MEDKKEPAVKQLEIGGVSVEFIKRADWTERGRSLPHGERLANLPLSVKNCWVRLYKNTLTGTIFVPPGLAEGSEPCFFDIYAVKGKITLIEKAGHEYLEEMAKTLSENAGVPEDSTSLHVLWLLFESFFEGDVLKLQETEDEISRIEEEMLKQKSPMKEEEFGKCFMRLRRAAARYHKYYDQISDIGEDLADNVFAALSQDEISNWKHYSDRAARFLGNVELMESHLTELRELYRQQIDVRQNRVMNILTVVTTIFMPLTLVTGWYGMNFRNMPELTYEIAYPIVIAICVVLIVLEIIFFKKKKML